MLGSFIKGSVVFGTTFAFGSFSVSILLKIFFANMALLKEDICLLFYGLSILASVIFSVFY